LVTSDGKFLISTGEEKSLRIFSLQAKDEIGEIVQGKNGKDLEMNEF